MPICQQIFDTGARKQAITVQYLHTYVTYSHVQGHMTAEPRHMQNMSHTINNSFFAIHQ